MARTLRTRPTRQVDWIASLRDEDGNLVRGLFGITLLAYDEAGNPIWETKEQEVGRRSALSTSKSDTAERRRRINRRDRHTARLQIRKGRFDEVELRQPRGRAISLAS